MEEIISEADKIINKRVYLIWDEKVNYRFYKEPTEGYK